MHLCSLFLYALYLLNYWFVALQGSTHSFTVFSLKGEDLLMELKTLKPAHDFLWLGNNTNKIIRHDPLGRSDNFLNERAEFSKENYSLRIKNLGLNDSGLYQAIDSGGARDRVIAEYHVTVQEEVSQVVLNVSSESLSRHSCKVSVTCSTQGSSLNSTFKCTPRTCSVNEEVVTSGVLLHLNLSSGFIVTCNNSNKVSWSSEKKEIKPLCFNDAVIILHVINRRTLQLIISGSCLSFFITVMCIGICYYKRRKKNRHEILSPGSDEQDSNFGQAPSIYSLLGPTPIPLEPIHPVTALPEGIYAQVDKPRSA